jgi:hypothetical protein
MWYSEIDGPRNTHGEGRNSYRIIAENPEDQVVDGDVMIICISKIELISEASELNLFVQDVFHLRLCVRKRIR